jgi:hypothetical protein
MIVHLAIINQMCQFAGNSIFKDWNSIGKMETTTIHINIGIRKVY